jgi:hypothetical protein
MKMGGSPLHQDRRQVCNDRPLARIRELLKLLCFGPGAYAPGFMPAPAPTGFLCKAITQERSHRRKRSNHHE